MKFCLFFCLALALHACGVKNNQSPQPDPEGITWTLQQLHTLPGATIPTQNTPTLLLDKSTGKANGSGGCNSFFAGYSRDGETLDISNIASTKMFCPDRQELENAYFSALDAANRIVLKGNILQLYRDDTPMATFKKA